MLADYNLVKDPYDLVFHLLSFSYLYGDYAIPHHLMNTASQAYLSVKKGDIAALRKFAARNWIKIDRLSAEQQHELDQIYQMMVNKYGDQIKTELSPLPNQLLAELGGRALQFGHYRDAHSFYKATKELDKKLNEILGEATQILRSKDVNSSDDEQLVEQKIQQAVELIYQALRFKNPFGNQFQILGPRLHFEDADAARKYAKHVEQSLVKELLEFGIQFLIDDKTITEKVINALATSKLKRIFLKHLAIRFSGGEERYAQFVDSYRQAVERLKAAKTEKDFIDVQKTLLRRGTGDNRHFQFLRELSLEHPISALLVSTHPTQKGEFFTSPLMLKSGASLLDFLELS